MSRKGKLEKALARRYIPSHEVMNAEFVGGLNYHADRLKPLHAALLETVKALELYASVTDGAIGHQTARLALAKLDKVIKEY